MAHSLEIPYQKLAFDNLDNQDKELVKIAVENLEKAHAPYSGFSVGSAIRITGGKTFSGSNQENAAYPSGLCAERVALFKAKSESKESIEAIVVVARNDRGEAADAFPCGACRQVMLEYAGIQEGTIKVLMRDKEGFYLIVNDARILLPFSFEANVLK